MNEEAEVEKMANEEVIPVESSYDSEIFYTENARLKVKAFAPEMHRYIDKVMYNEMPRGVEVIFYDSIDQESSRLTANYAIDRISANIMEAKNDVVIVNSEGETLNTEHLIWDRNTQRIYSEVFVKITTDDEIIMGEGFESNESFTKYKILKPKGIITKEDE
ncbi:MAG: LPS export ABC transporter periplasmic protein LptC [Vicingaceae bacterium]